jgi:hypothetical protein
VEPIPTPELKTEPKPSTDAKVESKVEDKKDDSKSLLNKGDKAEAKPEGAPEKYEAFKAPEGFNLDEKAVADAAPLFKELGLSQVQAQKLVDQYAKLTVEASEAPYKAWQEMQEKWQGEVKADPEIGGKLDQVKASIGRALDSLGDPALVTQFKEAMDLTGAGNNLAFVKAFYKLSQQVNEGKAVTAGGPSKHGQTKPGTAPESAAKALYPNLPSATG